MNLSVFEKLFEFLATPTGQTAAATAITEVVDIIKLFHKESGAAPAITSNNTTMGTTTGTTTIPNVSTH